MWIFRIVDIALLFFSAQHPMIFQNILLRFDLIGCGHVLTPPENARCELEYFLQKLRSSVISNFLVICELFLLSLLGMFTVSPSRNRMFDSKPSEDGESIADTILPSSSEDEIVCLNNS
jgi:hypothetical protein